MQLSGRPLLDNAADHALFAGREAAVSRLERSLRSGYNCLLVGPPGSGKTSLVRAVIFRSDQSAHPAQTVVVRANSATSATAVLTMVLRALQVGGSPTTPVPDDAMPIDLVERVAELVQQRTAGDLGGQVIVIEDVTAVAGAQLFGALRDELWEVGARWLVTTSTSHAPGLLRPPADAFFETTITLEPLTAEEAAELLRRRLPDPTVDELWPEVTAAARETPRRLLEVARELTAGPTVGGAGLNTSRGLEVRDAELATKGRPAQMLARELDALGWASASDERLLVRLGWTRPRVVQVIAELEQGGLVDMREESTGRGRPKKMYRLKPPSAFVGQDREPNRKATIGRSTATEASESGLSIHAAPAPVANDPAGAGGPPANGPVPS